MTTYWNFWDLEAAFFGLFRETIHGLEFTCEEPEPSRKTLVESQCPTERRNTLTAEAEQCTADNFAYFAAKAKGGDFVTAVTLREDHDPAHEHASVDVLLSGNKSPAKKTIKMLQKVLHIMAKYANEKEFFDARVEEMFKLVIDHCVWRIMARVDSRCVPNEFRQRHVHQNLAVDIAQTFSIWITGHSDGETRFQPLIDLAKTLATSLQPGPNNHYSSQQLRQIVNICTKLTLCRKKGETSYLLSAQDIETEKKLPFGHGTRQWRNGHIPYEKFAKVIHNIYQLARYKKGCRDLLEVAREYSDLFSKRTGTVRNVNDLWENYRQNVALRGHTDRVTTHAEIWQVMYRELQEQDQLRRNHTDQGTTHAEIWQVMYRELQERDQRLEQRWYPRPRFIGCNKAACYLCELFLTAHGQYQTSKAHNRIYTGWYLPDTRHMSMGFRRRLFAVAEEMHRTMVETKQRHERAISAGQFVTTRGTRESIVSPGFKSNPGGFGKARL